MISTAFYAARKVLLIPVIATAALCCLPFWLVHRAMQRRPHHLAELMARNGAMAERVRLHQLEQDRMRARSGRVPFRREVL